MRKRPLLIVAKSNAKLQNKSGSCVEWLNAVPLQVTQ